jgi:hypothetical protein
MGGAKISSTPLFSTSWDELSRPAEAGRYHHGALLVAHRPAYDLIETVENRLSVAPGVQLEAVGLESHLFV